MKGLFCEAHKLNCHPINVMNASVTEMYSVRGFSSKKKRKEKNHSETRQVLIKVGKALERYYCSKNESFKEACSSFLHIYGHINSSKPVF